MTLDEALQALHCPKNTDWAAVQREYDERYNELQRLRETATTREERDAYAVRLTAVEEAYAFLMDLPGFGPVVAPEPELSPELQQALRSPYADMRMGAVRTLGHLLHEDADMAPLAQQELEHLCDDHDHRVATVAREMLEAGSGADHTADGQSRTQVAPATQLSVSRLWTLVLLTTVVWAAIFASILSAFDPSFSLLPGEFLLVPIVGEILSSTGLTAFALWCAHRIICPQQEVPRIHREILGLTIGRILSVVLGLILYLVLFQYYALLGWVVGLALGGWLTGLILQRLNQAAHLRYASVIAGGWVLGGVLGAFLSRIAINGLLFSMPYVGLAIGVAFIWALSWVVCSAGVVYWVWSVHLRETVSGRADAS
jgi:hypothetical protein